MSKPPDRKALGKGLSALLPSKSQAKASAEPAAPAEEATGALQEVPLDRIDPNTEQPRSTFSAGALEELAASIRANGIIQPLIVQRKGDRFMLVAGERRWRASALAGLQTVPVLIREVAPDRLLELALIENLQREDLNAIEVAHALERLASHHKLSHEEIGRRTGKDRASVTNYIRLLRLPGEIQLLVGEHKLSMGHARALLGLDAKDQQLSLAERAAAQGLSVRQVERLVQAVTSQRGAKETNPPGRRDSAGSDPNVEAATRELEGTLGTRVRIVAQSPDRGRIEIDYFSIDELDRIYNLILGNK